MKRKTIYIYITAPQPIAEKNTFSFPDSYQENAWWLFWVWVEFFNGEIL